MEAGTRDLVLTVAGSPEGRAQILRFFAARQGETELMVELLGRLAQPAQLHPPAIASLRELVPRPEVQVLKAALAKGELPAALDPAVVEQWAAAHHALIAELRERWTQLSPQDLQVLADLEGLVV